LGRIRHGIARKSIQPGSTAINLNKKVLYRRMFSSRKGSERSMSYIDSILEPGEEIRYRTTVTWTSYGPAIVFALLALASLIVVETSQPLAAIGAFAGVFFLLATIVAFVPAWFRRFTTEIAVTNRRIILKRGLIRRHTVEMNMEKVESVDVDQSLLGRLFNYGDITIRGTGSSFERLSNIDAPLKLRTTVTTS
jgi:membrane protein YdbS with pleckstrin-like domain